jgi:hypothetical protein
MGNQIRPNREEFWRRHCSTYALKTSEPYASLPVGEPVPNARSAHLRIAGGHDQSVTVPRAFLDVERQHGAGER